MNGKGIDGHSENLDWKKDMANERITENLVRDRLRDLGYYDASNSIVVEEQKSSIDAVRKALNSEQGGGRRLGVSRVYCQRYGNP